MDMKKIILISVAMINTFFLLAQNIGIGTLFPKHKLSVSGTITVDHDHANSGTLDSASLRFGASSNVGITSNKNASLIGYRGLDFWTNNIKRISINEGGNVGIGITGPLHKLHVGGEMVATDYILAGSSLRAGSLPFSNSYKLQVNGGNSYFNGDGTFTGNLLTEGDHNVNGGILAQNIRATSALRADVKLAIGGATDDNYRLRVYDGNARIGGEFHATGNSAIGGLPDANYRFRVYDGNSRFGGDVQVTGEIDNGSGNIVTNAVTTNAVNADNVTIENSLTINGKGSVSSNGPSSLRIGFSSKAIDDVLVAGEIKVYTASIADFEGGNDDVRVMVSQFQHTFGGTINSWERMLITVTDVDAVANTCKLKVHNTTGGQMTLKGTIYLTVIAKN
jgi:hypothetical protein